MMGFADEIVHRLAQPVIATRVMVPVVHPLLHDTPLSIRREEKAVVIELISILHGGGVDFRGQFGGADQFLAAGDRKPTGSAVDFIRCSSAGGAFSAGNVDAEIVAELLVRLAKSAAGR